MTKKYQHHKIHLKKLLDARQNKAFGAAEYSATSGVPIVKVYKMAIELGLEDDFITKRLPELIKESVGDK